MLMEETTCVVVIWNGNDFSGARYKDYVDDIQTPEVEQLRYLVSLSKLCPRFSVVSTTDNNAWNLGPLFAKWMSQSLGFLQFHGINVIPFDSFIARTRSWAVTGNPMHLNKVTEVFDAWDAFFFEVVEFVFPSAPLCVAQCNDSARHDSKHARTSHFHSTFPNIFNSTA